MSVQQTANADLESLFACHLFGYNAVSGACVATVTTLLNDVILQHLLQHVLHSNDDDYTGVSVV